jgi:hypothetical protein
VKQSGLGARVGPAGTVGVVALGLGGRVVDGHLVQVDVDALAFALAQYSFSLESQLRVPVALRLTEGFALFAGPTMSVLTELDTKQRSQALFGESLTEGKLHGYFGAVVGMRLF